jgi:hypothetical protein
MRPLRSLAALVLACPFLAAAQTPDLAAILQRLDRLERENRALSEQVRALEARLNGAPAPSPPAAAGAEPQPVNVPLDQRVEIVERRISDLAQTKVEASQKLPIRLTGMALFNAFLNSRQSGGFDYPAVAAPTGPNHAGATLRQTILGLEFRSPMAVAGATVRGSVYMDFFAGATNQTMRLRYGSMEMAWKTRSIMVGVEKPIFNPREPSSLAQVGVSPLTGAGNLWLWLPQVRAEQDLSFGRSSGLRAQLGVLQTREVLPYPGASVPGALEPARPALEGRFELYHNLDDERRIEFAPGFHTSTTHIGGLSLPSSLYSFDWFANPWRRVELSGAFYSGQNVAPLGNGYGQGFYGYGRYQDSLASKGGWAQLTVHTVPRIDVHLFSGQQDDDNNDLTTAGRIGKNLLYGGNVYYRIAPNVLVGFEATQLRTVYIIQGVRINNHYDLALAYSF